MSDLLDNRHFVVIRGTGTFRDTMETVFKLEIPEIVPKNLMIVGIALVLSLYGMFMSPSAGILLVMVFTVVFCLACVTLIVKGEEWQNALIDKCKPLTPPVPMTLADELPKKTGPNEAKGINVMVKAITKDRIHVIKSENLRDKLSKFDVQPGDSFGEVMLLKTHKGKGPQILSFDWAMLTSKNITRV